MSYLNYALNNIGDADLKQLMDLLREKPRMHSELARLLHWSRDRVDLAIRTARFYGAEIHTVGGLREWRYELGPLKIANLNANKETEND